MLDSVNPRPNFPEIEDKINEFWKKNSIFEKQVNSKPKDNKYVFYDGPPFITGLPHYGHLLGSISKDVIPRYHAMKGKRVERVWGWDCHGLPIENKVEKALGLKNRKDIEDLGIDKFVAECYKYTRETSAEWDWYIDKIGRWADIDRAYRTMDQDYMETVMWVFKQLHDKDLIYEGTRTSLFCTRCSTPISNFEIAMDNSYSDMDDPAVTVKFRLKNLEGFEDQNRQKVYLISGKHAFASTSGYFAELKTQLQGLGMTVEIIDHINPSEPNFAENMKMFETLDLQDSIVITHSLGGASIMAYLQNAEISLRQLILIAPPYKTAVSTNPDWLKNSGYKEAISALDFGIVKDKVTKIDLISSNDNVLDEKDFVALAAELGANHIIEKEKRHYFGKVNKFRPNNLIELLDLDSIATREQAYMLAWTTTPWTLPSNRGLVVDKDGDYVLVKREISSPELEQTNKAIVYDPKKDRFLFIRHSQNRVLDILSTAGGKAENGESPEEAVVREVVEETGYKNLKLVGKLGSNRYTAPSSNQLKTKLANLFLLELENGEQQKRQLEEHEDFENQWVSRTDMHKFAYTFPDEILARAEKLISGEEIEETEIFEPIASLPNHSFSEYLILGKERLEETLEGFEYEIVKEFKGSELEGLEYEPIYDFVPANDKDFKVYSYDGMVNAAEGVGIVHSAPGFGEVDSEMGNHHGLTMMLTVDDEGKFMQSMGHLAGRFYLDANPEIVMDLFRRNIMLKNEIINHRFPFCYRCEERLIQKAQPSWFIDVQKIKKDLTKNNENINWVPEHIKEGRFGKGLETAPDWCISRTRFWGTPMPVWQAVENGEVVERLVIGSRDEIMERNDDVTKIVFVRHCHAEKSEELDASLTEKGKKLANQLVDQLKDLNPDVILTSSMKRCIEHITPYTKSKGMEFKIHERFGSVARKAELYARKDKIGKAKLVQMEEADLQDMLADQIEADRQALNEITSEYKGKTILVCSHGEVIASYKHILEGSKLLTELKRMPDYCKTVTTYLYKNQLLDLHRPVIDDLELRGDTKDASGNVRKLTRVNETLDVWMESASMPYAQKHYPFQNKEDVESNFPADYISEYIAQTRAWFYVMHVISTALWNKNSFNNVVVSGVIMGDDGRKMSKSFGNYPDPKGVLNEYGGDALRMYLMGTPLLKGENVDIDEKAIRGKIREYSLPLWNSYSFMVTYAEIHNWKPTDKKFIPKNELDIWVSAKFKTLIKEVETKLEAYDIPGATNLFSVFLTDLSKWYIRRSRDAFKEGDESALNTLYSLLYDYSILCAPFTPFIAEEIYQNLKFESDPESVHLCEYPHQMDLTTEEMGIMNSMDLVREICGVGQTLRVENGLKVRQPLSEVVIKTSHTLENWAKDIIKDELNVKEVREVKKEESGENFVSSENTALDLVVALNTYLTPELKAEGTIRELTRLIQSARKKSGLKFGELAQINIALDGEASEELEKIIEENMEDIKQAVNASELSLLPSLEAENMLKQKIGDINILLQIV